jgi:hypothetical protein
VSFQSPIYADAKLDTNERPFTCYCGLAFTRRDLLRRHEKLSHADGLATGSELAPSEAQHPRTGQHHQFYRGGDGQKSVPSCNDTFQQLSFSPMQEEHSEPRTGWSTLVITSRARVAFYHVITWKCSPTAKLPRRKQIYLIGIGFPRNRAYAAQATAGCSRCTSFIRWQRHGSVYSSDG